MGGFSVGCAFTLKGGVSPELADFVKIDSVSANDLIDMFLPQFEIAGGLHHPRTVDPAQMARLQLRCHQVWLLSLCDSEALKGGD